MSQQSDTGSTEARTSVGAGPGDAQRKHENTILWYLAGCILVITTFVTRDVMGQEKTIADLPAFIGAILLGAPLIWKSFEEIRKGRATSTTLAAVAIVAAFAAQYYVLAGLLAVVLLLADQVVRRTAWGAQHAIEQLVRLTPNTARVVDGGQESTQPLTAVRVGMIVRVRPGENLPVDGVVVSGASDVNQASLTGESVPVEVAEGTDVYAGTTNLTGAIDLRVTSVGAETTIGKVTQLIRAAESVKTPRQLIMEQVASYFVPVVLAVAGVVWFFSARSADPMVRDQAALRAIAVLVIACPSSLLLAAPSAMVAAFAAAARLGIMIKQTRFLEAAANIDTVVLDKTGTLTTGVFAVSRLAPAEGVEGAELLQAAVDGEQHSNHPLARSILETARKARIEPAVSESFEEIHGRGVRAGKGEHETLVGRAGWLAEKNPAIKPQVAEVERAIEGMTGVHVMRGGRYLGAVGLEDKLRDNASGVVERLRKIGVRRLSIFTGDRAPVARRVGAAVGVEDIAAECLPEEKYAKLEAMLAEGRRVLMVGDGINDGPCLAIADVGVAMGLSGSDIAANSAGVALMNDDLSRVPFLIELARRARAVLVQNVVASFIIILAGLALAATGVFAAGGAPALVAFMIVYHVIGDVFVLGNSFRLVRFGEEYAEMDASPVVAHRAQGASFAPAPATA